MKFLTRGLVLVTLLAACLSAFAQTTGSLTGTVKLEGGVAAPGVTVTISSPSLQGARTTTSDVNGNYNFGGLPPGEYTVRFELDGTQGVTKPASIGVSQTGRADAVMATGLRDVITVTASSPAVLETTEIQSNVPEKLIDDLPMGRRLQDAALLTAGVNNNGPNAGTSITISGGPAYDNVFMVNGAVINENLRGQAQNLFIEDAIQETTIITGAVSAEYGRFTGGVVNAITKSGGNDFHGSARDSLTNDHWTSLNTQFYDDKGASSAGVRRENKMNPTYEGTLGGRIIRDRLWFFMAGREAKRSIGGSLQTSSAPGSDVVGKSFTTVTEDTRIEGKLTGQITAQHTLVGSYLDLKNPVSNRCTFVCYDEASLDHNPSFPNSFYSVHYNGILTNSLLVEGNYSKKKLSLANSGGTFRDFDKGTTWYDLNTGAFSGGTIFCAACGADTRNNDFWTAKATYYLASRSFGTHNLVAGVENWDEERAANNYQSGSNYLFLTNESPVIRGAVSYPEFDSGDVILYNPIFALTKGSKLQTFSAYLNDKLDLNQHWSFNVGGRYDKNNGKDAGGATTSKDSNFSPRLGFIYDVKGNGAVRINGSYSKYVSKIQETIGGSGATAAGTPASISYEYRGDPLNTDHSLTYDQVAHLVNNWFQSQGGLNASDLIVGAVVPGLNTVIRESLKSPNVIEETVGAGMQLGQNGFVRVDLTHRDWNDFYATFGNQGLGKVSDQFGNEFDLQEIRNSNDYNRTYNAATVQVAFRPFQRLNLGGNYTFSKLRGNVGAETGGSGPITETSFVYPEYKAFAQNNPTGYLPGDQRHKLRAYATYDIPTRVGKFNVSALERFDSGLPYSEVATISIRQSASCPSCPDPLSQSYATPPASSTYFFSGRGQFRFDDVVATDLALNYDLPISNVSVFVNTDILNVFNAQSQIGGDTTVLTSRNDATLVRFDPFMAP